MSESRKLTLEDILDTEEEKKNRNKNNSYNNSKNNSNEIPKNQKVFGHNKRIKP